jgi:CDP-paratose 2-epimerase
MKKALVTGSGGLIGSESVRRLIEIGYQVVGIDNDMRSFFFGEEASTNWNTNKLKLEHPEAFRHLPLDIRDSTEIERVFEETDFELIIHTAAQPSHDWAAKDPRLDFEINAVGTLVLLEAFRKYSPEATFIFTSTNKVYGDTPNSLDFIELDSRWELKETDKYFQGIDESMSIDSSTHSVFGVSKLSADIMVQEYGRYFKLNTGVFRGGCLTGPMHSAAQLHGFLAYLVKSIQSKNVYTIFGYKGKQVRDNIHAFDLVEMFLEFHKNPKNGAVYNVGGGRENSISILEAASWIGDALNVEPKLEYEDTPRIGDHIWYISDISKFQRDYPNWQMTYSIHALLNEMVVAASR